MLFEADGVKAGGGENWIPMCLPGFNKNGYLYMYVSFLNIHDGERESGDVSNEDSKEDQVAILLISANKESFYELRQMRDTVVRVSGLYKQILLMETLNVARSSKRTAACRP